MKKLGIIGGLGPMATAYFLQLIVEMTEAQRDQEHIEVILHSRPQIPDRTSFILNKSEESPLPDLIEIVKNLENQGGEIIAIPCVTVHFFQKELMKETNCEILNVIEETASYLKFENITQVGIMATDGTIESGLFQEVLNSHNINCVVPDKEEQEKVMHIIYQNIKSGKDVEIEMFHEISRKLFEKGAQVILLACTELSVVKRDHEIGERFLDVMEVLARKSVLSCARLKFRYEHLITK